MLQYLKRRFLSNRLRQFDPTSVQADSMSLGEMQGELERLAKAVLLKAGVDPACIVLRAEPAGTSRDRRPVLRVMMDFVRWDATSALRLLLGLAHIERAMQRAVASSWIADSCHFAGVWLHPSTSAFEASSLRHLAHALASSDKAFASSGNSTWDSGSAHDAAYAPTVPGRPEGR